jgi:hypothetical protein
MNEMQLRAGLADYGGVDVLCVIRNIRQQVLHIHAGLGTSEQDMSSHPEHILASGRLPKFRMFT